MTSNPQDRARASLKKVGMAVIWGEGVFIALILLTFVIVSAIDALLPPEPMPMVPVPGRGTVFFLSGTIGALFIACFASGVFFSNTRKHPTLLNWPFSLHGVLSGFVIGGLLPALVLTLLSGRVHNLGWMGSGIPGAVAGFIGSVAGGAFHRLRARKG